MSYKNKHNLQCNFTFIFSEGLGGTCSTSLTKLVLSNPSEGKIQQLDEFVCQTTKPTVHPTLWLVALAHDYKELFDPNLVGDEIGSI